MKNNLLRAGCCALLVMGTQVWAADSTSDSQAGSQTTTTTSTDSKAKLASDTSIAKPSVFMSGIVGNVVDKLTADAKLKNDANEMQEYIVSLLTEDADIQFMSNYIVGPKLIAAASATGKTEFNAALTGWIADLYYGAFKLYDPKTTKISIYPVRVNYQTSETVIVHSTVSQEGSSPISVDYRCRRKNSVWKLYDLCVDNICVLGNLRSQVTQIVKELGKDAALPSITKRIVASTGSGSSNDSSSK
jgi:ABC-type transporter MlaC component